VAAFRFEVRLRLLRARLWRAVLEILARHARKCQLAQHRVLGIQRRKRDMQNLAGQQIP
jgi:hypothetical protein